MVTDQLQTVLWSTQTIQWWAGWPAGCKSGQPSRIRYSCSLQLNIDLSETTSALPIAGKYGASWLEYHVTVTGYVYRLQPTQPLQSGDQSPETGAGAFRRGQVAQDNDSSAGPATSGPPHEPRRHRSPRMTPTDIIATKVTIPPKVSRNNSTIALF